MGQRAGEFCYTHPEVLIPFWAHGAHARCRNEFLMKTPKIFLVLTSALLPCAATEFAPKPQEQQVPKAMHSTMAELPLIRIGQTEGDIVGKDNRALQAAVDYVAGLGGGVVEVGPGDYLMRDSLHLRSFVTVRGTSGSTVLRSRHTGSRPRPSDSSDRGWVHAWRSCPAEAPPWADRKSVV